MGKRMDKRSGRQATKGRIKLAAAVIFAVLAGIAGAVAGVFLLRLSILPKSLTLGCLAAVAVIGVLLIILLLLRKKGWTIWVILSIVYIVICGVGSYYLYHTDQAVEEIVTPTVLETDAVSVFVLRDDPAQELADIEDYAVGILGELDRENTDYAIGQIEERAGFPLHTVEYSGMDTLIDALKDESVEAVLVNHSLLTILEDVDGYEGVVDELRIITTISIQQEVEQQLRETTYDPNYFAIYLSGIDTYGGVTNRSRSDVNIIMAVNTQTKQILLLSTPRDYYVPLTISGGARDKLTHAGIYGVEVSKGTLEELYDITIPYYLRMNFSGFIDIIDALGGIDVYSPQTFTVDPIMTYHEGYNHVNGLQALAFARERYSFSGGDRQRGENQMEVIRATIEKCQSSSMLLNYQQVMESIAGTFESNIEQERIAQLVSAQLFEKTDWNIVSYSVSGSGSRQTTYSMPGRSVYVMLPDESTVERAKELLRKTQAGEILVQE